ncbi:MAG: AmmeMemoRadiSam system protein B [Planctomycetota bacterium]|nr:AmmeMemoRadiSam system protein B [Planctomycetota bacterium]
MGTRKPAVAGTFYPGDPVELRSAIDSYSEAVPERATVIAAIVPHAGYIYSGPVVGKVISAMEIPEEVLILGPNHTGRGAVLSLYPEGSWATPLGEVGISEELNRSLLAEVPGLEEDTVAHAREHCAEVQVPFLQSRRPDVRISVIIFATRRLEVLINAGEGIARALGGRPGAVVILSSSDMTHYEPHDVAKAKDQLAIDQILELNPEGLHRVVAERAISMCGSSPSVAALKAANGLGASSARLVSYRTSGEETGDHDSVVGYAGILIT